MAVLGVWGLEAGAVAALVGEGHELVVVPGETDRLPAELDACLVSGPVAVAVAGLLAAHKLAVAPAFFPVLALVAPGCGPTDLARVLEVADDVLSLSASPVEGAGRLRCLLASRERSLAARDRAASEEAFRQAMERLAGGIAGEIDAPVEVLAGNLEFLGSAFTQVIAALDELAGVAMAHDGDDAPDGRDTLRLLGSLAGLLGDEDLRFALEEVPGAIRESQETLDQVAGLVAAVKRTSEAATGVQGPSDVSLALEDAAALTRHDWKFVATLATTVEPDLSPVWLPAGVLRLGLVFLLLRAARLLRQRARPGGDPGRIALRAGLQGEYVAVVVETSGPLTVQDGPATGLEPAVTLLLGRYGAGVSRLEPSGRNGGTDTVLVSLPYRSRPRLGGDAA
ncbi:MAG: hypothetical protein AB7U59_05225 [Desulfovibrionaceae bacterium]